MNNTTAPTVEQQPLVRRVRVWQGWHQGRAGEVIGWTNTLRPYMRIKCDDGKIIEISHHETEVIE